MRPAPRCRRPSTIPAMKDVGRNGTYLVFRQLGQDVRRFWQFVHGATGGDPAAMDRLSSAMVGRTRTGEPLAYSGHRTHDQPNAFTFDDDPRGVVCPVGAHIRRANPRNTDYPGRPTGLSKLLASLGASSKGFRDDLVSPVRFHRVLRRGREYGPTLLARGRAAACAAGRSGARDPLRLPQRQHRAPVRVPAERLADEHRVRRSQGRDRSAGRQS